MNVALCAGGAHEKDGIADYARYAADGLAKQGVSVDQIPLKHHCSDPEYYRAIARRANGADICHLQFNYVYFNGELPYRNRFHDFAAHLKIPFVMTIHEIRIGYGPLTSRHAGRVKRIMFNHSLFLFGTSGRGACTRGSMGVLTG